MDNAAKTTNVSTISQAKMNSKAYPPLLIMEIQCLTVVHAKWQ